MLNIWDVESNGCKEAGPWQVAMIEIPEREGKGANTVMNNSAK